MAARSHFWYCTHKLCSQEDSILSGSTLSSDVSLLPSPPPPHLHTQPPCLGQPLSLLLCAGSQETDPCELCFPGYFAPPLSLCQRQCLWHLLSGSSFHQTDPRWFPITRSSCLPRFSKQASPPVGLQFRSNCGFQLLLFFGFSALPPPSCINSYVH